MYHTVTGINEIQVCQNCGKNIMLEKFFTSQLLGAADITKYMYAYLSGNVEQIGGTGGAGSTGSYRLAYSSMPAHCEECGVNIDETEILNALKEKRPVTCSNCGHKMPVKPADNFIKNFHPKAIAVVNDSGGFDSDDRSAEKNSMVIFKCMGCGAGLELNTDTGRTMKCSFCGNENYLPDAVWTKLHPDKEICPLFVILDIDGKDMEDAVNYFLSVTVMKIYDRHFENFIREYFEKPFESDALNSWFKTLLTARNDKSGFNIDIEKIQKSFFGQLLSGYEKHNIRLREAAAAYGNNIPIELQQKLSSDSNEGIRMALAKNIGLNKEVIKKLQNDNSPAVASEAKKHKTGFFNRLFG